MARTEYGDTIAFSDLGRDSTRPMNIRLNAPPERNPFRPLPRPDRQQRPNYRKNAR